jgi:hypothetical protein
MAPRRRAEAEAELEAEAEVEMDVERGGSGSKRVRANKDKAAGAGAAASSSSSGGGGGGGSDAAVAVVKAEREGRGAGRGARAAAATAAAEREAGERDDEEEQAVGGAKLARDGVDGKGLEVGSIVRAARAAAEAPAIDQVPNKNGKFLNAALANQLVGDVMRLVLFCNMSKTKCTSKKLREMMVVEGVEISAKAREAMLLIAMHRFKDVFGFELVCTHHAPVLLTEDQRKVLIKAKKGAGKAGEEEEVGEKPEDIETTRKKADNDVWILLNLTADDEEKRRQWRTHPENALRGLLLAVLGCVAMDEGRIPEASLRKLMTENMGLPEQDPKRAGGGNDKAGLSVASALKAFEEEGYLVKRKAQDAAAQAAADGVVAYEYTYGPAAILEVGLPNVLRFIKREGRLELSESDIARMLGTKGAAGSSKKHR